MDTQAQTTWPTPISAVPTMWHEPIRVLFAEDDADTREMVMGELVRDGFEVVSARDGLTALYAARNALGGERAHRFDVVISDVQMPGLTGLELLVALQRTGGAPPFILITAFGGAELHETAMRLGAWVVIDKPFAIGDLEAAVRSVT
jgi:DNA-binding response OmpR family regulator